MGLLQQGGTGQPLRLMLVSSELELFGAVVDVFQLHDPDLVPHLIDSFYV